MTKLLLACLTVSALYGQTPSTGQLRSAAERSIKVIQRGVSGFTKTQDCFSCHSHALPALTFRVAREHGVAVDEAVARTLAVKGLTQTPNLASIDHALQNTRILDPAVSEGWALITADAVGARPTLATAIRARLIANWQRADGHWPTLDIRPPQSDSIVTATAIALRALQLHLAAAAPQETAERVTRAQQWLLTTRPRTTEEHTFRLLGLHWSGAGMPERAAAAKDLLALQRPTGGWAQLPRMSPDAYATGEALVALHEAGDIPVSDPAWQKGIRFLLSTQAVDGSWRVATRMVAPASVSPPYFESGFPYGKDQMVSISGTTWAAMAILSALPKVERASPPPAIDLAPSDVQPWMQTALFGSVAQLKAALDSGLDPNSKSAEGTTLLMFVAPDAAKARLLIERGADVKAKAKTGYTALMTASMFRGTAESVKLLLEKGAEAAPGTGVTFNASPLFLAAIAGDSQNLALLRAAGADANRKMLLLGFIPFSPLFASTSMGDPEVVKAVLAAGADPREVDRDNMNALHFIGMSEYVEVARMLIAAGTPLNQPDKHGFTPLMYAATIDYGNAEMVKALLAVGADKNVRTKDGKTALSQATRFRYPQIREALAK